MLDRRLAVKLEQVGRRVRRLRLWTALTCTWLLLSIAVATVTWLHHQAVEVQMILRVLVAVAAGAVLVALVVAWRSARDMRMLARLVEHRFPDLDSRLLTAIEQQAPTAQRMGFLQETVVRESLAHAQQQPWQQVVSTRRLAAVKTLHWISLGLLAAALVVLALDEPNPAAVERAESRRLAASGMLAEVDVQPGDTEIERGRTLLVLARFASGTPDEVQLLVQDSSEQSVAREMTRSLDDPLFGGRVESVQEDFVYRVKYGDLQTRPYRVTVFEYPRLVRANAHLVYPQYTTLEETVVEDTQHVSAVEGTQLTLKCRLNKPVAQAWLRQPDGADLQLVRAEPEAGEPAGTVYSVQLTMDESRRMTLHLRDEQGRANQEPPEFVITVLPNQPPKLELAAPARDMRVTPLEELKLKAQLWDDFGLHGFGVSYSLAGSEPRELVLGESAQARQTREVEHVLAMEDLAAEPNQLVSYHWWAEDAGPDGQPRRVVSDMYFAEVRHFEEIFRQGQSPSGGQSQSQQQGSQAQELVELQKQIINGTWNLLRKTDLSGRQLASDAQVLAESQGTAREQLQALGEQLARAGAEALLEKAAQKMETAREHLQAAADEAAVERLRQALPVEQAAYQTLLSLQEREFQVARSRNASSSGGVASRSQQQLDQLELEDSDNRYETQRTAQAPQDPAEREIRQALNRLRELARRQRDVNEQLKQLQSALQEAKSQQEREEIERQLKRLREEQQQLLRDVDELRNRMDRPENQQRMSDARQQLDTARSRIRDASEALEQGMVSQAAASGTRAQQELEQLRDEFRKQASGQFSEQMQQMREQARQLNERQQELGEQMDRLGDGGEQKSLRSVGERQNVEEQLQQQRAQLDQLFERMKETVQQAEQSEPLLSSQLYDAMREAKQSDLEESLELSQQMLQRGFPQQAQQAIQPAAEPLAELQRGVEAAAESVLGDPVEALRRARQEVDSLREQLDSELARSDPRAQGDRSPVADAGRQSSEDAPSAQQDPGESSADAPDGERPQGQGSQERDSQGQRSSRSDQEGQQQSEGRPSEQQAGGGQPGEQQADQRNQGVPQAGQQPNSGQAPGQQAVGQPSGSPQAGSPQAGGQQSGGQQSGGLRTLRPDQPDAARQGGFSGGAGGPLPLEDFGQWLPEAALDGPITGESFREWSDRLRDVEEMVDDPELRAEAARIRDRAREMRVDIRRHGHEPNWDLVRSLIAAPLTELRQRIDEELLRRQSRDELVPIDRDPVPSQYTEPVRRYYERLGSGE